MNNNIRQKTTKTEKGIEILIRKKGRTFHAVRTLSWWVHGSLEVHLSNELPDFIAELDIVFHFST